MIILYISALEGGKYSGPVYSVPKQVYSQSRYDKVYWINLTKIENVKIFDKNFYHYMPWYKFSFSNIPEPFNNPDLIIFEEFFKVENCYVAKLARKKCIPYIIVPRCQMTENYLKNKQIKKIIASKMMFKNFAKNALTVQFLTNQEKNDSIKYYAGKYFIAPNGIDLKNKKLEIDREPIMGTFIGRYSIWQKGLDLLLEAVYKKRKLLESKNIQIQLYGPNDRSSSFDEVKRIVSDKKLENIVTVNGPVFDEEKERILLNSIFFIHTSRFEGMPMSVLDALSYGIPCLVTQGSNMREIIEASNAGWGAEDTADSIGKSLEELCNSINEFKEKGDNAWKLAESYSWDSIAKECHNIYITLI